MSIYLITRGCIEYMDKEEFQKKLDIIFGKGHYEVMGDYKNRSTPVSVVHLDCGYGIDGSWKPRPYNMLNKHGCPRCGHKRGGLKERIDKDKFLKKFKKENATRGNAYKIVGEYIDYNTPIKMLHKTCNRTFHVKPEQFINSHTGCTLCYSTPRYTQEEAAEILREVHSPYTLASTYRGMHKKCDFYCPRCKKKFPSDLASIRSGEGCPRCANRRRSEAHMRSNADFIKDLKDLDLYDDYRPKEEYKGSHELIYVEHLKCHNSYPVTPNHLLRGSACPFCSCPKRSKGERWLLKYLTKKGIKFEYQKTYKDLRDHSLLSYDIYVPDMNLLIEYNGLQHYQSCKYFGGKPKFEKQKKHDRMKYEYAKDHGIKLLTIPYLVDTYAKLRDFLKPII